MQQDEGRVEPWPSSGRAAVAERAEADQPPEWADLRVWARWIERRGVLLAGVAMIVVSLVWKAQFLSQMYFRQDDFHLLDRALQNPLSWAQLTYVGAGHLIPGPYLVAWLVARVSLYDWTLASAVSLVFVIAASLAALRLLRTLFGDRPAILIPLLVYLACPLTLPDLGIWSSALESVPLQLAIFMAVDAQVRFVRTQRWQHVLAAAFWVVFGLFFFEKGLILPLLLFAVTSGFLVGPGSWLANAGRCLVRYWRVWLLYLVLVAAYSAVLKVALKTSVAQPGSPHSAGRVLTFMGDLIRDTFAPGAIGGLWSWSPVPGSSYSFVATPDFLAWLSLIIAAIVMFISVLRRRTAWRAWVILLGWIAGADMLPVIVGRISDFVFSPTVLGQESRYVADAVPVLAICVGLAFLPLAESSSEPSRAVVPASKAGVPETAASALAQATRIAGGVLIGVFLLCSVWSVQSYQSVTNGSVARSFVANAGLALKEAPHGSLVVDGTVPGDIVLTSFGRWAQASTVIGDLQRGEPAADRLHWTSAPSGSFNSLLMFGADGRLHLAGIYGTGSSPRPAGANCWADRGGQVRVPFNHASPSGTKMLRIGYLWYSQYPGSVTVRYGTSVLQAQVTPGLNGAYVPVTGSAKAVYISGFGNVRMCVGDAEAGILVPSTAGATIPATP